MPGVNCAVFGCGPCRRTKGIEIFKLPSAKDEKHKKWREECIWLGELKKTRELDEYFRRQINQEKVFTCEKHFYHHFIEICKCFLINHHSAMCAVRTLRLVTKLF